MDDKFYNTAVLSISMLAISIIFYLKSIKKAGGKSPPPPPGPRGLPIVGYLPFLGENPLPDFKVLEEKYGPIYKLRLGHTVNTVISSPSLAKEVLQDHDAVFAHRRGVIPLAVSGSSHNVSTMSFSDPDPQWRHARKLFVQQMMSAGFLKDSHHVRREAVRKTVGRVYADMAGKPVNIGEISLGTELGVLMDLWWGETVGGELGVTVTAEVRDFSGKIMDLLSKQNVSDYFPFLARFDLQGIYKEMEVLTERVVKTLDFIIAEHHKRKKTSGDAMMKTERRKDLIRILLELIESGDAEISGKQLRGMFMDVIAGGTDTAGTIVWVMSELMNNPEAMSKVQNELNDVVGSDCMVEEFHIPKLNYLEGVVKETLRLHPPVPLLIPRSASQDSTIGGFTIPKDFGVFVNIWSIQRNPAYWENPMEFKPERFLDANRDFSLSQHYYLPFGSGRRMCSGQALGLKMLLYLVASLLHSFEWCLPNGGEVDMTDSYEFSLRKATPLILIPTPRLSDSTLYE